ncbi:Pumilio-like protein 2 [Rhypophila decipiens]|uniref:Pumilio-like protein 2 n=1 Tax=Rhypophila decipiens TaxID=261697 RepID=A0AAN6Y9Q8_9PEZI|nr:Pumilio-like protein 2 [Rhypophila decipiens]
MPFSANTNSRGLPTTWPAPNASSNKHLPSLPLMSGRHDTTIWGPHTSLRPGVGSARETNDNLPSGSGTLTDSSEAEPPFQSRWSSQVPNLSGNSSPSRQRTDLSSRDYIPFFPPQASQSAIGQRGSSSQVETGQISVQGDTGTPFSLSLNGGGFRGSQNSQYPAIHNNRPTHFSSSETNASPGGHHLDEATYGAYSTHSHRPSIPGVGQGHRGFGSASGFSVEESDLRSRMNGMSLGNTTGISNGITTAQGFQSSQLNPNSQPWDNSPFIPDINDSYRAGRRSHGLGRSSPAGVAFNGQQSFPGTPHQGSETWSRPASRDQRTPADPGRALMQPYWAGQPQPQQYSLGLHGNPLMYQQGYPAPYDNFAMPVHRSGYHAPASRHSRDMDGSPLLQEYKSSLKGHGRSDRRREWELRDVFEHVVEFCGDQAGSRFIQEKIATANTDEKTKVCEEILPEFVALSKDVFGNYVVQKLFEHGTQAHKRMLADKMWGQVVSMSMNPFACRVVQEALEHILTDQVARVAKELEPEVLKLMQDVQGNHVVQKLITLYPHEIGFVIKSLKERVGDLSCQQFACRVVQRALEHGNKEDKRALVGEIHANISRLVVDQYGNYVAQHVIEKGNAEDRAEIISYVTNRLMMHSKHKYASNVVEKCIVHGTDEERRRIVEKLVGRRGVDDGQLQDVMKDSYGNYVVQKLLKTLKGPELEDLKDILKPHLDNIKRTSLPSSTLKHINQLESVVCSPSTMPTSPTPASPGLQGNGGSTVPTPNLTTEPNSPSSNPPSTKASSVGDGEHQTNGKLTGEELNGSVTVQVRDDGC